MSYNPLSNFNTTHDGSSVDIEMPIRSNHPGRANGTKESESAQECSDASSISQKRATGTDAKAFSVNGPRPVRNHEDLAARLKSKRGIKLITTSGMIALSIPFFVYAGIAWTIHGRVVDKSRWAMLQQMGNKLGTLFPIVFAVVLARAFTTAAAWRLERGTTLGSLEQIMSSQTVGSTVFTLLTLRRLNLLAVFLVCVWSLSPTGSQSNIQMLNIRAIPISRSAAVNYFDTDNSLSGFDSIGIIVLYSLGAMFQTCVMSPQSVKTSSVDLWYNVKVPDIARLPSPPAASDSSSWINVTEGADTPYSSLLGIPLRNISSLGQTEFQMETSYITIHCTQFGERTELTQFNFTSIAEANLTENGLPPGNTYYSNPGDPNTFTFAINGFHPGYEYGYPIQFLNSTMDFEALTLRFDSPSGGVVAHCPINTTYVESQVICNGPTSCAVTAVRPSQLRHPNTNLTTLGFLDSFGAFEEGIKNASTATLADTGTQSALEVYLRSPYDTSTAGGPQAPPGYPGVSPPFANVTTAEFELRLQQVVNAYWYGSYDPETVMHSADADPSQEVFRSANGTHTVSQMVYTCSLAWLVFSILATSVMVLAAIASGVFSHLTQGPEVLSYCSSMLRNTPYVAEMSPGSTIGGMHRSREFQHVRIRLADVESKNEVGYIAVTKDEETSGQDRLLENRLYR